MAKDIQQLERVQRHAARFVKDYRHTTFVTGLFDEFGWLPLFERHKHSRLTVFYKVFNNLSAISLDHLSVSSRHTRASNDNKFMSLPVRTDAFKYSFFPRTITDWNSLPLAVRLSQSIQSFHGGLLSFADHLDTPVVTGGLHLHPLLDISPKNRISTETDGPCDRLRRTKCDY